MGWFHSDFAEDNRHERANDNAHRHRHKERHAHHNSQLIAGLMQKAADAVGGQSAKEAEKHADFRFVENVAKGSSQADLTFAGSLNLNTGALGSH